MIFLLRLLHQLSIFPFFWYSYIHRCIWGEFKLKAFSIWMRIATFAIITLWLIAHYYPEIIALQFMHSNWLAAVAVILVIGGALAARSLIYDFIFLAFFLFVLTVLNILRPGQVMGFGFNQFYYWGLTFLMIWQMILLRIRKERKDETA